MFCEGFFLFPFTPNVLMYSELREVGEGVKAINENLLTCGCVRSYACARDARECARLFVSWGERWKSGEECKRKWGGMSEEESPNRKDGLVLRKGECGGKRVGRSLEKSPDIGCKMGRARKKSTSQGKKRERFLEKSPEIGCKMGKGKKKWTTQGKKRE